MKTSNYVISTIVIVFVSSILILYYYYREVPTFHKVLIVISTTAFSGILAHGMFKPREDLQNEQSKQSKNTVHSHKKKK